MYIYILKYYKIYIYIYTKISQNIYYKIRIFVINTSI